MSLHTVVFEGRAKQTDPLEAASVDPEDIAALAALAHGKANQDQQKLVVAWLMRASGIDELEYRSDERLSAFASGKRWIAKQFCDIVASAITEKR